MARGLVAGGIAVQALVSRRESDDETCNGSGAGEVASMFPSDGEGETGVVGGAESISEATCDGSLQRMGGYGASREAREGVGEEVVGSDTGGSTGRCLYAVEDHIVE